MCTYVHVRTYVHGQLTLNEDDNYREVHMQFNSVHSNVVDNERHFLLTVHQNIGAACIFGR